MIVVYSCVYLVLIVALFGGYWCDFCGGFVIAGGCLLLAADLLFVIVLAGLWLVLVLRFVLIVLVGRLVGCLIVLVVYLGMRGFYLS